MAQTVFDRLRTLETEGMPLRALILEACEVGDELVFALEALVAFLPNVMNYEVPQTLAAKAAIARAYSNNGDTPDNGKAAA